MNVIHENYLLHNVAEIEKYTDGTVGWKRLPQSVIDALETEQAKNHAKSAVGVEIRFLLKSGDAVVKMAKNCDTGKGYTLFHVFRGGLQGTWQDHEVNKVVDCNIGKYVIEGSTNSAHLEQMTKDSDQPFDPRVIRLIFDLGRVKILGIEGDVEPPPPESLPPKTLLAYGSSITSGSNSLDRSHSWVSVIAHDLKMDALNLALPGNCRMESEVADYIAQLGESGEWDVGLFELGINVLAWDEQKARTRVKYFLDTVAKRNSNKPIFVISPFICGEDAFRGGQKTEMWRRVIREAVADGKYQNVTYVNGYDILDSMKYMSCDEVHPNIYGVARIAELLTGIISDKINK